MKDEKAGIDALIPAAIVITVLVVLFAAIPIMGYNVEIAAPIPLATAASGTLTFTGNSSCGEAVNITNAAGTLAWFYINVTGITCQAAPADAAVVSLTVNTSTITATNLTTAINNNATVNGTMTATNPSSGVVTLTYATTGTTGNTVALVETAANGAWSASTLTGGNNGNNWNSQQNANIANASELWSTNSPLLSLAVLIGIVFVAIGMLINGGNRINSKGGGGL